MRLTIIAAALAATLSSTAQAGSPSGCDSIAGVTPFTQFNYAVTIQAIWNNNCDGCHIGGSAAGLSLSAPASELNLINVPSFQDPAFTRVIPGDPVASLLFLKINCDDPGLGGRMPMGTSLSSTQQRLIFDWIANGAPLVSNGFEDR